VTIVASALVMGFGAGGQGEAVGSDGVSVAGTELGLTSGEMVISGASVALRKDDGGNGSQTGAWVTAEEVAH
jgi:hypothetical protein